MSVFDDPSIPQETHDLARLYALEHLVASFWFVFAVNQAERLDMPIAGVAREFRQGVLGSMAEGAMPPAFLALVRAHAGKVMDKAVGDAETADQIKGAQTFDVGRRGDGAADDGKG